MSDRELLELAAKAAGVSGQFCAPKELDTERWGIVTFMGYGSAAFWNPLTDDGDALRLAVKLGMLVSIGHFVDVQTHNDDEQKCSGYTTEVAGTDPYASTRRAIVRAAAAIAGQQGKDK